MLKGLGASPGLVVGKVALFRENKLNLSPGKISDVESEWDRLTKALADSKKEIMNLHEKAFAQAGADSAAIFEAHELMLEDPEVIDTVRARLESEKINVAFLYFEVTEKFAKEMAKMEDAYLKERANDIRDVAQRVLGHLLGLKNESVERFNGCVLVAEDLKPSFTASLDPRKILGFVIEKGGVTSHTAILARNLGIPAIVGVKNIFALVKENEQLALNGDSGQLLLNPTPEELSAFNRDREKYLADQESLKTMIGKSSETVDGHKVELVSNMGSMLELEIILKNDAEGVGLFRTEFLYLERKTPPTEDEQYKVYSEVIEKMGPQKNTVLRTLDIGADKQVDYLGLDPEENPAMGYRALRYCLDHQELFKDQLRAMLRASVKGNLAIMVPMVQSYQEVQSVIQILNEVKADLRQKGKLFSDKIQFGIMIEIPVTIFILDELLPHLDFVSIGTNDLIQYLCAADRMNSKVSQLYDPYHPGVLRALKMIMDKTHQYKKWVGMCGELAANTNFTPLLLAMGLDEFSVSPSKVLSVRKRIRECNLANSKKLLEKVLTLKSSDEVRAALQ
jgi:phosphotransferase system enzyme I (PtsI)